MNHGSFGIVLEPQALADRVLARPVLARQRDADDGDGRRGLLSRSVKVRPDEQRNAHRREVAARHRAEVPNGRSARVFEARPSRKKDAARVAGVERTGEADADGLQLGPRARSPSSRRPIEPRLIRALRIARLRHHQVRDDDVLGLEPGIDALQPQEAVGAADPRRRAAPA